MEYRRDNRPFRVRTNPLAAIYKLQDNAVDVFQWHMFKFLYRGFSLRDYQRVFGVPESTLRYRLTNPGITLMTGFICPDRAISKHLEELAKENNWLLVTLIWLHERNRGRFRSLREFCEDYELPYNTVRRLNPKDYQEHVSWDHTAFWNLSGMRINARPVPIHNQNICREHGLMLRVLAKFKSHCS